MKRIAYTLFDTPIGTCGIVWSEDPSTSTSLAVRYFQLPESSAKATGARIAQKTGAQVAVKIPAAITRIIKRVQKHLNGQHDDFRDIPLDLEGAAPFAQRVYAIARTIPPGKTVSYGYVAAALRQPNAARAVGHALGKNPIALIVPCHRVLAANGKPGGFSAYGGLTTKARMLAAEGASAGFVQREFAFHQPAKRGV